MSIWSIECSLRVSGQKYSSACDQKHVRVRAVMLQHIRDAGCVMMLVVHNQQLVYANTWGARES